MGQLPGYHGALANQSTDRFVKAVEDACTKVQRCSHLERLKMHQFFARLAKETLDDVTPRLQADIDARYDAFAQEVRQKLEEVRKKHGLSEAELRRLADAIDTYSNDRSR